MWWIELDDRDLECESKGALGKVRHHHQRCDTVMGHNRKYACQDRDPHECDDHRSGSDISCVIAKRCSASTSPIPDLA